MKYTYHILTISGTNVEFDTTEKPIFYGGRGGKSKNTHSPLPTPKEDNVLRSAHRAKKNVRHLVEANAFQWLKPNEQPYLPVFITFTFALDIRNVDEANSIYTDSMQRLNYFMTRKKKHTLQYLSVIEFQDETRGGVVHYHTLFFNMRYINQVYDEIKRVWKHGNINVKSVRNIKKLSNYMVKYMTKNMKDERLSGKKKFFTSRGLLQPKKIMNGKTVLYAIKQIPEQHIESTHSWQNQHCGKYTRITYNLAKDPKTLALLNNLMLQ